MNEKKLNLDDFAKVICEAFNDSQLIDYMEEGYLKDITLSDFLGRCIVVHHG